MSTILLKKVKGSIVEHNSMFEKELKSPINLNNLCSTSEIIKLKEGRTIEIPDYMDHDFDIASTPLYKYLNDLK